MLSGGKKALDCLTKEAAREKVSLTRLETEPGRLPDTLRSALVSLDGEKAMAFSERWCGTLLWICTSPYRPHHGRKTGTSALGAFPPTSTYSLMRFVSRLCALPARVGSTLIKPTRQCGPRTASGISVKVQSERSQHANKRLARLLIAGGWNSNGKMSVRR